MRSNKLVCMLAITTIVCLLMIAMPTAPTLAAESLRVSPTKGTIGDEIKIRGSGYDRSDIIFIYFSSRKAGVGVDIEELGVWARVRKTLVDEGDINTSFDVPDVLDDGDEMEEVCPGKYFVYSTHGIEGKIRARAEFTVTGISSVYPTSSIVGTRATVKGVGFHENKDIEIFYDGDEIEIAWTNTDAKTYGLTVVYQRWGS